MADITIRGNATKQAELRFTQSGTAVLNFDIAENHSRKDPNGQWQEDGTTFYRVAVWKSQAEALAGMIDKGTRVMVHGRFRGGEFTSRDGVHVRTYEVTADQVGIIPKGEQQGQQGGYGQGGSYASQNNHGFQGGYDQQPRQGGQPWGGQGNDQQPPF